jgi:hypothetical protein
MRRRSFLVAAVIAALALIIVAQSAVAGPVVPYNRHPHGHSYQSWMRIYGRWLLGDESNPLIAGTTGDCGRMKQGVFFLVPPIDVGVEFDCTIPRGTPILLSHAGQFAFASAGETDAELQAMVEAGFVTISNSLQLDGRELPLKPIDTKPYTIVSERGSFFDTVAGVGTGPIRTAIRANLVFIRPLSRGDHVIEAEVHFDGGGGDFSATYHIHVRGGDGDDD